MNGALGYATFVDYIDPSAQCGGAFYTRSFAIGVCVDHSTTSNIYSYDGSTISNTVFNQTDCVGMASKTDYTPGDCLTATSTSPANTNDMYSTVNYNAVLPVNEASAGVDSL